MGIRRKRKIRKGKAANMKINQATIDGVRADWGRSCLNPMVTAVTRARKACNLRLATVSVGGNPRLQLFMLIFDQ